MAGKGSRNRTSDRKAYEDNYDLIFRKKDRRKHCESALCSVVPCPDCDLYGNNNKSKENTDGKS